MAKETKAEVAAAKVDAAEAKAEVKAEKAAAKLTAETPPQVNLGVSTINDHEQRLWALEKKAGIR
jgi:hypothetical protein